jgi:prepilin-type N-terminal cleavage/methylation domain-containing protein
MNRGFTLLELVVSIGIFSAMTALVVAKYGNFNQSTLLTDTAYDIALALHTAQNYGLSVKNAGSGTNPFGLPYALDFTTSEAGTPCGSATANNKHIVLYGDSDPITTPDGVCGASDSALTTFAITRGAAIAPLTGNPGSGLCVGSGSTCSFYNVTQVDISFTRPYPEAKICANASPVSCYGYAEVIIVGTDGSTRTIAIRENGQVSVKP